jgi:hypothetical protein
MHTTSEIIVYENGDILDKAKCKEALFLYWEMSKAEKRSFNALKDREDLEKGYHEKIKES